MIIYPDSLQKDESRSNHLLVAITHPDCKIKGICFGIVVGPGRIVQPCKFLKSDAVESKAECVYEG